MFSEDVVCKAVVGWLRGGLQIILVYHESNKKLLYYK